MNIAFTSNPMTRPSSRLHFRGTLKQQAPVDALLSPSASPYEALAKMAPPIADYEALISSVKASVNQEELADIYTTLLKPKWFAYMRHPDKGQDPAWDKIRYQSKTFHGVQGSDNLYRIEPDFWKLPGYPNTRYTHIEFAVGQYEQDLLNDGSMVRIRLIDGSSFEPTKDSCNAPSTLSRTHGKDAANGINIFTLLCALQKQQKEQLEEAVLLNPMLRFEQDRLIDAQQRYEQQTPFKKMVAGLPPCRWFGWLKEARPPRREEYITQPFFPRVPVSSLMRMLESNGLKALGWAVLNALEEREVLTLWYENPEDPSFLLTPKGHTLWEYCENTRQQDIAEAGTDQKSN